MNLYFVSQDENTCSGSYHAMIVAAATVEEARGIHPDGDWDRVDSWCYQDSEVAVVYIGKAKKDTQAGVILSSFS